MQDKPEFDAKAHFEFRPIAHISTPFKQKFGIPRQSQSLSKAIGNITFSPDINASNACRGLSSFSHLWLSFVFHENLQGGWKDTVRPPRLGGNEKIGVFATRSTFRPNPLGLSVVRNLGLNNNNELLVEGVDLLDQTPILDIKPYIHYADSVPDAESSFAALAPVSSMSIEYSPGVKQTLLEIHKNRPEFEALLLNVLEQDPRPAYKALKKDDKIYSIHLFEYDIKWRVNDDITSVISIKQLS